MSKNPLKCPACEGKKLTLKHEANFIYSYLLDADAPGLYNNQRFDPYVFDRREQTAARSYIECNDCGQQLPCTIVAQEGGFEIVLPLET